MSTSKKISKTGLSRLRNDYMKIKKDPVPYIVAEPTPSNILIWHYVVIGPEDSPYAGGFYHGKVIFPPEFPFKPPSILMCTPNGRFEINTRLCLSISDYHPDTWNPAWSVSSILTGLLSFMLESSPTMGSIETTISKKHSLALRSGDYNLRNKEFCELFPDIAEQIRSKRQLQQAPQELPAPRSQVCDQTSTSHALLSNMALLAGIAIFAYAVKLVLTCASADL